MNVWFVDVDLVLLESNDYIFEIYFYSPLYLSGWQFKFVGIMNQIR
jgi:hypothetical protein